MKIFLPKEDPPTPPPTDQGPEGEWAPKWCAMGSGVSTSFTCHNFIHFPIIWLILPTSLQQTNESFYQPEYRWKEFFPHPYTLWELKKQNKQKINTKQTKIYPSHPRSPKPVKRWQQHLDIVLIPTLSEVKSSKTDRVLTRTKILTV